MRHLWLMIFAVSGVLMVGLLTTYDMYAEEPRDEHMTWRKLTPEETRVIEHKGTEAPFTGKYDKHDKDGNYQCKRCGALLFSSETKFDSGCGWPAFDEAISGAVEEVPDADGVRTEIVCADCGAHLGHVFRGEGLTPKDVRHCVNSVSVDFEAAARQVETAYFAGGCFWGVEYYLERIPGVISVESGYMGGNTESPGYEEVCSGTTGHAEVVKVEFSPSGVTYEEIARIFFEIHDPTQINRQGPDIGDQYRSGVFVTSSEQRRVIERLIDILKKKGYKVATQVAQAGPYTRAESYHQDYYERTGKIPYCHSRTKRFDP
jgi:peptide methionine sulfoxide reductase msrA/msrB